MNITIVVQTYSHRNPSQFRELLRNSFELEDDLKYDFQSIISGVKLLYPNKNLVFNFQIM